MQVAVRAIHAAGYLAWGCSDAAAASSSGTSDPLLLRVLLKGLLKLFLQKNEEVMFAGRGFLPFEEIATHGHLKRV